MADATDGAGEAGGTTLPVSPAFASASLPIKVPLGTLYRAHRYSRQPDLETGSAHTSHLPHAPRGLSPGRAGRPGDRCPVALNASGHSANSPHGRPSGSFIRPEMASGTGGPAGPSSLDDGPVTAGVPIVEPRGGGRGWPDLRAQPHAATAAGQADPEVPVAARIRACPVAAVPPAVLARPAVAATPAVRASLVAVVTPAFLVSPVVSVSPGTPATAVVPVSPASQVSQNAAAVPMPPGPGSSTSCATAAG
jgi:hypothetical protein